MANEKPKETTPTTPGQHPAAGQTDKKAQGDEKPEQPLSPREQAEKDAEKLSDADKKQIIADAVQGYLRTNYITGVTLVVCEQFVADSLKAARSAAQTGQQTGQHASPQHQAGEGHTHKS